MDILGSALTSPTVSWAMNRNVTPKRSKYSKSKEETSDDQPDTSEKFKRYQSTDGESSNKPCSLQGKLKEFFRRVNNGSTEEAEPLLTSRPKKKSVSSSRDKLKVVGKKFRKALHQSIRYMAVGMENMSTMVYVSANVPSSVYYNRNQYDPSTTPYY